jgi:hypothetical protein
VKTLCGLLVIAAAIPLAGSAQSAEVLDWRAKLQFHAESTYAPTALIGFVAYGALLQKLDSPTEWGQGAGAYGERVGSTLRWSGIHSALAFGLDTTLHQDPRYYRAGGTGFWRRAGHAVRGTILTRTDSGGETLSTWRIGSAYGSALLSDMWYPARLNNARDGMIRGSVTLGFELAGNLGTEFWPDIKQALFHRRVGP